MPDEFEQTLIQGNAATEPELSAIVIVDGVATTYKLPALAPEISIGRFTGSTLVIDHHTLSRFHAVLRPGPPMTIEDLGSANGTFVREIKISPGKHALVTTGDVVRLGLVLVILRNG